VDVIAVTHNSAREIEGLLDSIPDARGAADASVAVVDNASSDDTARVVGSRTDCVLVHAPNLGYAAGVNRGVAELAGDGPILVTNPDVRLAPGCITEMVSELSRPGVGIVVPRLHDPDGTVARSLRREPTVARSLGAGDSRHPRFSEIVNEPDAYETAHDIEWATGAVMLIARACFDELGGFDESFFMYSEETDFCLRARDAGWSVRFTPAAEAVHVGGASGRNPDLYAMQVLNRIRLYRRRHGLASTSALVSLVGAREAVFALRGVPDSRRALECLCRPSRRPRQLGWSGLLRRTAAHDARPTTARTGSGEGLP